MRHERPTFKAGLLQEPGQSAAVVQVEADGGRKSQHKHLRYISIIMLQLLQSCDHSEAVNSLADEQQVDLSWVNQVNVGQSVHPLQTRMDPTVQLTHTKRHRPLHTLRLHVHSWKVHIHYLTMIFLPLNSRMMQDRPTS